MSTSAQLTRPGLKTPSAEDAKINDHETDKVINNLQHWMDRLRKYPPGDSRLATCLNIVSGIFFESFKKTRSHQDLGAAAKYLLAAVSGTPEGHPDLSKLNHQLGQLYGTMFRVSGDIFYLKAAYRRTSVSIAATAVGDPYLVMRLVDIATLCIDRYKLLGEERGLGSAVRCYLAALSPTGSKIPIQVLLDIYAGLGATYYLQYCSTGKLDDINTAIRYYSKALAITPLGHPKLPIVTSDLGVCHTSRFCRFGQIESLRIAQRFGLASLGTLVWGSPGSVMVYQGLGHIWKNWYLREDIMENLEHVCGLVQARVTKIPKAHPVYLALQTAMGVLYLIKYKRTKDVQALEVASRNLLAAVTATPENHPDLRYRIENLGICHSEKYTKFGDMEDLEAAIKYLLKATKDLPKAHFSSPTIHWDLGQCYMHKYQQFRELGDLGASIKHSFAAVTKTPRQYPDLPFMILTLGLAYIERYKRLGNLADLDDTTELFLDALGIAPDGHPATAAMCAGLGSAFLDRFKTIGLMEDLVAAIEFSTDAINGVPPTYPNLPLWQCNLGESYSLSYLSSQQVDDWRASHEFFKLALQSQIASPQMIWHISTIYTAQIHTFTPRQLLMGYHEALKNLPTLLWLGSNIKKRHNLLLQYNVPKFISKGVWTALQASEIQTGVEFIEQGLSTTHKQSLQLRDENSLLQAHLPTLSHKLHEISMQLQVLSLTVDQNDKYYILAQERQHLVSDIRQQPGFEGFLLAPKYSRLSQAAEYGPVILLNCVSSNSDAIIILSPSVPPIHLSLPGVTSLGLTECITNLKNVSKDISIHSQEMRYGRAYGFGMVSSGQTLESVTSWIWENVVEPVFDCLLKNGIQDGRLWWCPSGAFTYLPLHAAAPLESPFIQSYTPTLETLIHANQVYNAETTPRVPDNLAAVGVVRTSGMWAELPSVDQELDFVTEIFGEQAKQLKDSEATIDNVMDIIESSSWLHLACHGQQDPTDPLKSSLILYDGVLELGQIMHLNLSKAKFVYLSACETAMGDSELRNEAMHLAGGFLAAGFLGAIGTLWSMADAHGPKIAEVVYSLILGKNNTPDVKMAAKGLHLAVQRLRREGAPLYQWVPFIHLGV